MTDQYPTIELRALVPDNCNFVDKVFEAYVARWMRDNMPSIPMGMLNAENVERWQMEPDLVHTVKRVKFTMWECEECGTEHYEEPQEPCCTNNEQGSEDGMVTVIPSALSKTEKWFYVIQNDNAGEYLANQRYIRHERLCEDRDDLVVEDEKNVLGWEDEGEAQEAAETADRCYQSEEGENGYGFPWAHSYAFIPDGYIKDESLKKAGFRVATYCGGSGDWRNDEEFRLAGIDGGGYSFAGSHFAKLVAYHHEYRGMTVETAQGRAYITTDYRSDLEKLGQDVNLEGTA